jgi:hypothetical protein
MTAAQHSARIVLPRSGLFHSMQTSGWGRARRKSPCRKGAEQRRVRQLTFSRAASRKPRGFGETPLWNVEGNTHAAEGEGSGFSVRVRRIMVSRPNVATVGCFLNLSSFSGV